MHFRYPRHRPYSAAESSAQGCRSGPSSLRRQVLSSPLPTRFSYVFTTFFPCPKHRTSLCTCSLRRRKEAEGEPRKSFRPFLPSEKARTPFPLHAPLPKVLGVRHRNLGIKSRNLGLSACACTVRPSPPRQRPPTTEEKERAERAGPSPPLLCHLCEVLAGLPPRDTLVEVIAEAYAGLRVRGSAQGGELSDASPSPYRPFGCCGGW
jgi:hypothetical protein